MRPFLFLREVTFAVAVMSATVAPAQMFRSGPSAVPLVELFTSEGCSSCPPAEHWLGELRHDQGLWRDFVPVAWHVNYWDRLGWPDKFAAPAYTDRQYAYAQSWRSGRVYTPGFVRAGQEWTPREHGLSRSDDDDAPVGVLTAEVADGKVTVRFEIGNERTNLVAHVALLGGGIASDVRRGENRGKQLEHEFLVLGWRSTPLRPGGEAHLTLPASAEDVAPVRQAVAIWISRQGDPGPLQATGGWLDK
ncbi:DUF1223 domain-containing protein [Synoicihabitans lomoniglobus]|uniref:DUF1223 domain-containing protein n=1 Tax=Synoicihabitans lomoniglobus TaxID=2909285 RepID=A0AAF0CHI4_9BACT|nr:DUF1223 domain-containing protein [Opitutaceae bacterium LMO-M01]WED64352.1 DUF1223 domain-containing protein [Opitutaceae bacterium LMO-M01]